MTIRRSLVGTIALAVAVGGATLLGRASSRHRFHRGFLHDQTSQTAMQAASVAVAPQFTEYTLRTRTFWLDAAGNKVAHTADEVIAQRSDGVRVRSVTHTQSAGAPVILTIYDPVRNQKTQAFTQGSLRTTTALAGTSAEYFSILRQPSTDCLLNKVAISRIPQLTSASQIGSHILRHEKLGTLDATVIEHGAGSGSLIVWYLPALGCEAGQESTPTEGDGGVTSVFTEFVDAVVGPPDAALFSVADNFREVSPSALMAARMRFENCNAGVKTEDSEKAIAEFVAQRRWQKEDQTWRDFNAGK